MGLEVVMLTGDNNRTATAIGKQIGVDTVISDVLPQGKEQTIGELAQRGERRHGWATASTTHPH